MAKHPLTWEEKTQSQTLVTTSLSQINRATHSIILQINADMVVLLLGTFKPLRSVLAAISQRISIRSSRCHIDPLNNNSYSDCCENERKRIIIRDDRLDTNDGNIRLSK